MFSYACGKPCDCHVEGNLLDEQRCWLYKMNRIINGPLGSPASLLACALFIGTCWPVRLRAILGHHKTSTSIVRLQGFRTRIPSIRPRVSGRSLGVQPFRWHTVSSFVPRSLLTAKRALTCSSSFS